MGVQDFAFITGSMGTAVGAAFVAGLDELSTVFDHRRPLGGHIVVAGTIGAARGRRPALRRYALLGERFTPFCGEIVLVCHGARY